MTTIRHTSAFAAPEWRTYRPVQAVPFPERVTSHVDRLVYVGMAPRRPTLWERLAEYHHAFYALVLLAILIVAIIGTGNHVEVGPR